MPTVGYTEVIYLFNPLWIGNYAGIITHSYRGHAASLVRILKGHI